MDHPVFKYSPAVFAVGKEYQIMVWVKVETLMWIRIGEECFYDDANGTLRSATELHKMSVPRELLEREKGYTVCYRVVNERLAYFSKTEDIVCVDFPFRPIEGRSSRAYLLADTHNNPEEPLRALRNFEEKYGKIDFLISAGDIQSHSGSIDRFETLYRLMEAATGGEIPIVFAKGNHEQRGICAERMGEFTPTCLGNSYFSFRIGNIWGLSLDCGEDKNDANEEYGYTVACHPFRIRQTKYIAEVAASGEYKDEGIEHRLVVVHHPFYQRMSGIFDIEGDIYSEWCRILGDSIKPDIMISGHLHRLEVNKPGDDKDAFGLPCLSVVGSRPVFKNVEHKVFTGTGFFFEPEGIRYIFNDSDGNFFDEP